MDTLPAFLRQNAPWLAAGFLLTFASSFGQTFLIAVFAGEIRSAFGLSHGAWGGIYTLATMASAAVMVFAGGATDRFRVRHIGLGVFLGLAAACLAMASAEAVWVLVAAVFLLRLFGQGMMGHAAMVAMARWFAASRGRAVSVAGLGVAVGEALLPLLFAALLTVFDWRLLWVAAAAVIVLMAPVLWRLLRTERLPRSFAVDSSGAGMDGRHWSRAEVLRHPLFWFMVPALLGPSAWNTAFFFHQVHMAEARGWPHVSLVALFPLFTVTAIGAMLAAGAIADRFGSGRLAAVYLLPAAAGYAVLAATGSLAGAAAVLVLLGLTQGMTTTVSAAFWAEFFGTAHLGRIRAMTTAVMVLGTALGPGITGLLIDAGLDFPDQGWGIALYFAAAAALAAAGASGARRRLLAA